MRPSMVQAFAASHVSATLLKNPTDVIIQQELAVLLVSVAASLQAAVKVLARMTEECNPGYKNLTV